MGCPGTTEDDVMLSIKEVGYSIQSVHVPSTIEVSHLSQSGIRVTEEKGATYMYTQDKSP
jgi:uncharacterized protein (DUF2252 family)